MAAVLERDRTLRAETARRKRFSVGTACGTDIGSRCRTIGLDLGGDHCGTAQAADSNQQEWAFLRRAAERTIPGLRRAIRSFLPRLRARECANYFRHAG